MAPFDRVARGAPARRRTETPPAADGPILNPLASLGTAREPDRAATPPVRRVGVAAALIVRSPFHTKYLNPNRRERPTEPFSGV